jgi:hypothetical protein
MTVEDELGRVWKKAVVAYFSLLSVTFSWSDRRKPWQVSVMLPDSLTEIGPWTSKLRSRNLFNDAFLTMSGLQRGTWLRMMTLKAWKGAVVAYFKAPLCHSCCQTGEIHKVEGSIQKFPDWPPWARTANGTVLCQYVQLYRYFVNQSNEFCRHNALCCFSTSVCICKPIFPYRLSPETFGYA